MRWPTWLRRTPRQHAARHGAGAQAADTAEQVAARQRVMDMARAQSPGWNAPTAVHRPLMTRGQAARGHGGRP